MKTYWMVILHMTTNEPRELLYQSLISNKHFLYLFDVLKHTQKQFSIQEVKIDDDLPDEMYEIIDTLTNYIFNECNLYLDEYELFLARNNLTFESDRELIEKTKKNQGFTDVHASRDIFVDLMCEYRLGNCKYTKEQIIKQIVFWDQNILFDEDADSVDFHYKEPRYKMMNFRKK